MGLAILLFLKTTKKKRVGADVVKSFLSSMQVQGTQAKQLVMELAFSAAIC